jgi:single-stranded DNA-binding protein
VVFVLDPFPGLRGARLAHACEVVCRERELASTVRRSVQPGVEVMVTGELVMERVDGPIEDDLSAVRARIKATSVTPSDGLGTS